MNTPLLQDFLRKNVATSLHGIAECSEQFSVLLFGMGVAAVDALFNAEDIGPAEAARWRTELRETLDRHHPEGYAQYLELIKDWPADVHCTGHVDYDPASRLPDTDQPDLFDAPEPKP